MGIDFFVALFYLSIASGAVAVGAAFDGRVKPVLLVIGFLEIVSTVVWYEMAVISTSYYANTVQSLVNLGRVKLANEMGLELPGTLDHERRMWWLLMQFVYHNDSNVLTELDQYRQSQRRLVMPGPDRPQGGVPAPPKEKTKSQKKTMKHSNEGARREAQNPMRSPPRLSRKRVSGREITVIIAVNVNLKWLSLNGYLIQ
jgi:hypothetical protein